jgi:hypothetical protein
VTKQPHGWVDGTIPIIKTTIVLSLSDELNSIFFAYARDVLILFKNSCNNPIVQPLLSTKFKIVYNGYKIITIFCAFFQKS